MAVNHAIRALLPKSVSTLLSRLRSRYGFPEYARLSTQERFTRVYEEGVWGKSDDPAQPFYSGSGSRSDAVVGTYLQAVETFLAGFERRPDVVDLGCGDFFVGSRIRPLCAHYVACDIVPALVEHNRHKFAGLDVDFRLLDLTRDELPDGEVVFVRQVLQHLSNAQILRALPRLVAKYRYLVLTEHLPDMPGFVPNLDKPSGPGIRTGFGSGVVLTRPPFDLEPLDERTLCGVRDEDGCVVTTLYRFAPQPFGGAA